MVKDCLSSLSASGIRHALSRLDGLKQRDIEQIEVKQCPAGNADGLERKITARPRGKREKVD